MYSTEDKMSNEEKFHLGIKALVRNQEKKVLLLKVNVDALERYSGDAYWDIPGGRIQIGSTIEDTLRREILEETGIKEILSYRFFSASISNIRIPVGTTTVGLILFVYECKVSNIQHIQLSDEHVDFGWFTVADAVDLLKVKYSQDFIEQLRLLGE
jgi:8-oxo-dGTP pyrophosphatase MutT (NUDIX family)